MSDHVHYVCVPRDADSLAKTLNTLHMRYSQYFNDKKGRHGHLWQGRFYSSILDDRHALEAMRYDETNPVRRGLVEDATAYPWSSVSARFGRVRSGASGRLSDHARGRGLEVLVRRHGRRRTCREYSKEYTDGPPVREPGVCADAGRLTEPELDGETEGTPEENCHVTGRFIGDSMK